MSGPAPIEVAAAIVRRGGTILIAQRHAHDPLANFWEFPGGKREPGETFEDCLARELREELGIVVRVGRLAHEVTHSYPERTVRLCFYECELLDGEPEPLDCQDCRWVHATELRRYQFPPADDELIELLTKP
ncbi:MAG: 8-oxo-dGTP diphosphatase MutT [Verrucomicrobia bacterium]|nr:8-oxo-dGTP diphosphatase MutT [Verrucomicrobiota bacterium]